ncbi:deoxynucleoside kinase [Bacillus sp. FJAT-49732]|uniref:Deoxynucleoside kinase n=1 Tax=Lederbergia citrisecunda TaxID=2833583 RepID=A0A942TSM6_9BACI|nr:deoxynucleoside kinase [Lederbergia citrisecunda]
MRKYHIPENSIITIAGTVGVGKTTMTKRLANALQFQTSFEQVDVNPYLHLFYEDFKSWSFHLQIYFLAERFKEQKRIYDAGGGFVQDRSIYEDADIFARMHYENGTMTEIDYQTYVNLFEAMVLTPYFPQPDLLIYLDGPLEYILERIHLRGRPMETKTSDEYWIELHNRYENWIRCFDLCPVMKLNIKDYDLLNDQTSLESIVEQISNKIQKH